MKLPSTTRIPTDEPGPFDALTTEQKLALVTSDALPRGIGGFLMDVIDEDSVELSSDITDHYIERNTSIQDHVALRPELVTLHGVISELSILRVESPGEGEQPRPNALPDNDALAPAMTPGALQARADAQQAVKLPATRVSASKRGKVLRTFENAEVPLSPTTARLGKRQADVYSYFYQLWKGRQFVTVETAWGIWPCMVIQSLRVEQPSGSRFQSDFYATFKAIRFASDVTTATKPMEPVAGAQSSATADNGQGSKEPKDESLLHRTLTFNPFKRGS